MLANKCRYVESGLFRWCPLQGKLLPDYRTRNQGLLRRTPRNLKKVYTALGYNSSSTEEDTVIDPTLIPELLIHVAAALTPLSSSIDSAPRRPVLFPRFPYWSIPRGFHHWVPLMPWPLLCFSGFVYGSCFGHLI
jgi:hypothetical protein